MAPHEASEEEGSNSAQATGWTAVNHLMRSGYSWSGHERNNCFLNLGDGTFADISYLSGLGFTDDGRGAGVVDWDGDGDLDVWLQNRAPRARLMRNEYDGPNRSLAVFLTGTRSNRDAVGARAELRLTDGRRLVRTVRAGVNYAMQASRWLHFGLGEGGEIESLFVRWPSGETQELSGLEVGGRYRVVEGEDAAAHVAPPSAESRLAPSPVEPSAPSGAASIPLGVPFPLPTDLGLTDFAGERHAFAAGEPTLVNFWASWCSGCMLEFADFAEHADALEEAGVRILACSLDAPEDLAKARKVPERFGLGFPMGLADPAVVKTLESLTNVVFDRFEDLPMPTSLLLNANGEVARIYVGPCEAEQLIRDVAALDGASGGLEVTGRASAYAGGRWLHAAQWVETQRGTQLLKMSEMLEQEGHAHLAAAYALELARFARSEKPKQSWLDRAEGVIARAVSAVVLRDPAAAEAICREFLHAFPGSVHARVGLTAALLETGDPADRAEAAAIFDEVRPEMRPPANERDHTILGVTLYRLGDLAAALPHLEQAVALSDGPPDPTLTSQLGFALDRVGREEEGLARHRAVLERLGTPTTVLERSLAGITHLRLGDLDPAVHLLEPVVAAHPERAVDRLALGRALAQLGRDGEALPHVEAALAVLPADAGSEHLLGLLRARTGDLAGAVENFERARELAPDDLDPVRSAAFAYDRLGRNDLAVERFRQILAVTPDDAEIRGRLADACARAGLVAAAIEEYRALGDDPQSRYGLAWLLATCAQDDLRDGEEALAIATQLAAMPQGSHPQIQDLLAAAHAELGQFEDAVRVAEGALESARDQELAGMLEPLSARLELYRAGQPFRQPTPR